MKLSVREMLNAKVSANGSIVVAETPIQKKLFELVTHKYVAINIIPDRRMPAKSFEEVINACAGTYRDLAQRLTFNQGISYTKVQPMYFEILYDTEISFNFVVREPDSVYLKNKLQSIFPDCTIAIKDTDYISEFEGAHIYKYNYEKHYLCSLATQPDKSPLNSLLAIKKDIGTEEKALFSLAIVPMNKQFKADMHDMWDEVKKGKDIINRRSFFAKFIEGLFDLVDETLNFMDEVIELHPEVEISKDKKTNRTRAFLSELKSETKQKPNYDQFKCQFQTYVKTDNRNSAFAIAKSVETALKDMASDNELVMDTNSSRFTADKDKNIERQYSTLKPNNNILSTLELSNLVRFPDGMAQRRFKLPSINIRNIKVPKEVRKGMMHYGQIYREGKAEKIYLPEDRDIQCLALFLLTKQGGGKTTFLLNFADQAIKAGHGLVLFDYIRDCTLGNALTQLHPECLAIRFDKVEELLTFGFPEVAIEDTDTPYVRKLKANMLGDEVRYLLNAMAKDTDSLTRIMSEYLKSACKVVFVHNNKTLKDVYDVLVDDELREEYIEMAIDANIFHHSSFEIKKLRELNSEQGQRRIEGLLDRFSIITDDTLFQEMFEKPYSQNVNFVDIMDNSKPVVFLMPQSIFTNKLAKDVICTYFMSRIRLAMSRRKEFNKIAHVMIDELHQIPQAVELISDTIAEPRKFSINYCCTLHSFSQIEKKSIREKMLDVGCNFLLLKGCSKSAYDELKPIIGEDYEYEDIGNMDYQFGALNLISIKNNYQPFISELPPALRDEKGNLYIN